MGTNGVEHFDRAGQLIRSYSSPKSNVAASEVFYRVEDTSLISQVALGMSGSSQILILNLRTFAVAAVVAAKFQVQWISQLNPPSSGGGEDFQIVCKDDFQFPEIEVMRHLEPNSMLVGYANGFIGRYEIGTSACEMLYNPLGFQKLAGKNIIYQNLILPGISDLHLCKKHHFLVVCHRKSYVNQYKTCISLEETPIYRYGIKEQGEKNAQISGCAEDLLQSAILERRSLLIALTASNQAMVFSYVWKRLLLKIDFGPFITTKQILLPFRFLAVHKYLPQQVLRDVTQVYSIKKENTSQRTINGDILTLVTGNGSIMLSQIYYDNDFEKDTELGSQITWSPLKVIGK